MAEYLSPPFDFSDMYMDGSNKMQYRHSNDELRIMAKTNLLEQQEAVPRKQAELERTLSHIVFELAYRTDTVQDYIAMHNDYVREADSPAA